MRPARDTEFEGWLEGALQRPLEERLARVAELTPAQLERIRFVWEFWARPEQLTPEGAWTYWLLMAGRGFGKTRTGAETTRMWARTSRFVNLIGATSDDARDIMIDGEAGILAVCPPHERPEYRKSERKLLWPNGGVSLIFTADEPERLRGKQHEKLWADELGAWRYSDAWDQALLGLRLGANPQAVVTTTPRPSGVVKAILTDLSTVVTRGTSYDNRRNLAPAFYSSIITRFEGTRLGRQELNAELLEDNPNALWQRSNIDHYRVKHAPTLERVVGGVDPAVTSGEESAETGIVFAGRGPPVPGTRPGPHFYVLGDLSLVASPEKWAREVVRGYRSNGADRIIGETNNGGDMVETVLRTVDQNIAYTKVTATRGKAIRAEPIAALYEQGRVHHVGSFPQLEDQLCDFDPSVPCKSPDRMDALVWALTELLNGSGRGVLEYYRDLAEEVAANSGKLPERNASAKSADVAEVRLRMPPNGPRQVLYGSTMVQADVDGIISVPKDSVPPLIAAGWTEVAAVRP